MVSVINQVAQAYSVSPLMQPFRELVKENSKFTEDHRLQPCNNSKAKIESEEGLGTFDTSGRTSLQKTGSKMALDIYFSNSIVKCAPKNAPICCPDGCRIVYKMI